MSDWVVRRWAHYGHERLYAETAGGTALGYFDLKSGSFHCDDASNLPLLMKAVGDHLAGQGLGVSTAMPPAPDCQLVDAEPKPMPEPPLREQAVPEWIDLSGAAAGAAARERALAERAAQGRVRHAVARLVGAKTNERAWRIGADGEVAVADQLARLAPQWHLLHAVRVGSRGSDIDHVVIGPGGVFTVNAKNHPHAHVWVGGDTFMVNGQRLPYVRNSRFEARRAARMLTEHVGFPVDATGVIAVMGAHKGFTIKAQPEDGKVVVTQRKRVRQFLLNHPPTLTSPEIDAIYEVARRSTTWQ